MSNYCKNCYELTEELENHKRWIKDYKQQLEDAEEFANAKITQCGNLIKQLNETFEQLEAYKMEAEEGKEINAELKAENEEWKNKLTKSIFEDGKKQIALDITMYERDKLKQTLTEIKEIAESEMDSKEFMAVQCMLNGSVDNKNKVLEQILQKISECEANQ